MDTISKTKAWILAARPKTLAASISPVMVGAACAYRNGELQWIPALLCLLVALFAQIAANLSNDYFDFKKGADQKDRLGQARAVSSGWIEPKSMLIGSLLMLALACFCGLGLLFYSHWWLIFVGVGIAITVLLYTAGPYPLAYHGWGDLCVILFYGIVPVCFTYFVLTDHFTWNVFWLSMAMGLISTNILIVNNYRDINQDLAANKRTTIVKFGQRFGRIAYLVNIVLSIVCAFPVYLYRGWNVRFFFVFFFVLQFFIWQDLCRMQGKDLNRVLEQTARNVFLFALMICCFLLY